MTCPLRSSTATTRKTRSKVAVSLCQWNATKKTGKRKKTSQLIISSKIGLKRQRMTTRSKNSGHSMRNERRLSYERKYLKPRRSKASSLWASSKTGQKSWLIQAMTTCTSMAIESICAGVLWKKRLWPHVFWSLVFSKRLLGLASYSFGIHSVAVVCSSSNACKWLCERLAAQWRKKCHLRNGRSTKLNCMSSSR